MELNFTEFWSISKNNNSLFVFIQNSSADISESTPVGYTWVALSMVPVVVFGITGNVLVIIAITVERRLQNITNYFLMSLALTDMLVSLIVMPFSIVHTFFGFWPFALDLCNLFLTSDVFMCTCSIFHMCTISFERFLAIRYPLKSRNKSRKVVIFKICIVWLLSFAISSPITVLGRINPPYIINDDQCALVSDDFVLYGSIFAFFIPLTIMIVMYALTVYMLHKQAEKCRAGNTDGSAPLVRRSRSAKESSSRKKNSLLVTKNNVGKSISYPLRSKNNHRPNATVSAPKSPDVNNLPAVKIPESYLNGKSPAVSIEIPAPSDKLSSPVCGETPPRALRFKHLLMKHNLKIKVANVLLQNHEMIVKRNTVRNEQKASKVLGIVFLLFVVLWAPFFTVNVLTALCKNCVVHPTIFIVFVWLGYISSTINPIIYTIFNSLFKKTFANLLRCKYDGLGWSRRRSLRRNLNSS